MLLTLVGDGPLYQRLYRGVRAAILDGRLAPGMRLPSTRAVASDLGLSRNVVLLAFEQLLAEGYVEARVGAGTFVSAAIPETALPRRSSPTARPAPPRLSRYAARVVALRPLPAPGGAPSGPRLHHDFRYGVPSHVDFPHAIWSRLVSRRARAMRLGTLRYGRAHGYLPLRAAIAGYLARARGVVARAEQVVIVNGTQQALDLVTRLLVDPGDRVVVEEPSYQAARQVFAAAGATLVPVPVDAEGLLVSRLPRGRPVRLAYVTPSHQFPLGGVMPVSRRLDLLAWARDVDAHVVEDDYDSEFRYAGRPVEAVQGLDRGGRVLYVGTFSKVLFPSLRIGYLVVPEPMLPALAALKFLMDYQTPTFEQEVLTDFIEDGHFESHLRRARRRNGERRAALLAAADEHLGDRAVLVGADAGIHVAMRLPDMTASALPALIERAAAGGVGVYPAAPYYLRPPRRAELVLGYACLEERAIRAGIRGLAEALESGRDSP
jgi:GntR family transcriptional regulator/MocR family aminotransferase